MFLTGQYSPIWLFYHSTRRKNRLVRYVHEVVNSPQKTVFLADPFLGVKCGVCFRSRAYHVMTELLNCESTDYATLGDSVISVHDSVLKRQVVKIILLYGFRVREVFHHVEPGLYKFSLRVKCQKPLIIFPYNFIPQAEDEIKHTTRLAIEWRDDLIQDEFKNPRTERVVLPARLSRQNMVQASTTITSEDWERVVYADGWFQFTTGLLNITMTTDVVCCFWCDKVYSPSEMLLDYFQLEKCYELTSTSF